MRHTWVLFQVLLEFVVLSSLIFDILGVGGGVVGHEEEVDDAERDVQEEQGPREL